MAELEINSGNAETEGPKLIDGIQAIIDGGGTARVVFTKKNNGTLPMLKLWRMWMGQIADFMNKRGRRMPLYMDEDGNPKGERLMTGDDCHHAYTHLAMGCDENGVRLSWAMSDGGSSGGRLATTGERLRAMDVIWQWAMGEGIPLVNPENSEYRKLQEEQNS